MTEIRIEEVREFAKDWEEFKKRSGEKPIFRSVLNPPEDWKTALDWELILLNRILPHSDCLIISVAGGTNTGKSTIINVLIGKEISPVLHTAGATKRPVMITSPAKYEQCLNGDMFPQFKPTPLRNVNDVLDSSQPNDILFVVKDEVVSDKYLLLDTPDVDSIRKEHWDVADRIISASDVVIAVLTEEKYNDFAIVDFFRRVKKAGKIIIPLMNKVSVDNPQNIEFARDQISHFLKELEIDNQIESFYFPRSNNVFSTQPVSFSDSKKSLQKFIDEIPLEETKQKVLNESIRSLRERFTEWLNKALLKKTRLVKKCLQEIESRIGNIVGEFQPVPPKEIENHLGSAIKNRLGWMKYLFLIPGDIFVGFRKEGKEELYRLGEKLRANNEKLVVDIFEETLKLLNETLELIPDEFVDEVRIRLGEIIKHKSDISEKFKDRVIKDLNLIPDEIIKEIDMIAEDFVNSGSLSGLKFLRAVSALLFILGAGVFAYSLLPGGLTLLTGITGLSLTGFFAYFLENESFIKLQEKMRGLIANWIELKRGKMLELFNEILLSGLYSEIREFVELSEDLANKESIRKILIADESITTQTALPENTT